MPLQIDHLPAMFDNWRERQVQRDERHDVIDQVVAGEFEVFDPDDEVLTVYSPNMIQVGLEDTAEASSLVPTPRSRATKKGKTAKAAARKMESIAAGYMDANELDVLIPRLVLDAGAYGFHVVTILPDYEQRIPLIERRDPRTCYTEDGYRPGDTVRRALFARQLYLSQLPEKWQLKILHDLTEGVFVAGDPEPHTVDEIRGNNGVVIIEYFDDQELVLAALYQHADEHGVDPQVMQLPVELERRPNKTGVCPVVIGARITLDGEFRGQWDQVVGMLEAHIRLFSLLMDYADQAVYSDIFVKDLIGEMPYGGGAYIELGPNGAIGRVPPAVSSLDVQRDLENLVDGIHLGGRWPKSRPGEIDQSIASAKFLESSVGMLNTAIRTYHQILQRSLGKALRISFLTDKNCFPGEKTAHGILRNQEFLEVYNPAEDIDMSVVVKASYGLGFGRDPGQSAVLHIQYGEVGYISKRTVRENIDGIDNVQEEEAQVDLEKLEGMALAKLMQGIEMGEIPKAALVQIHKAREDGRSLIDIFEEFVVKPEQEAQATAVPTGMGGQLGGLPMPPGLPPPPGAPGALGPPPPPAGADLMARMNTPAGPGGTLGTQVLQEGA